MTYAKIEDDTPDHPKFVDLSDAAWTMWSKGCCYCSKYKTDGRIPLGIVSRLCKAKKHIEVATELVRARLWEEADGGYQVHDYLDHNRSAEEIRALTESKQRAGKVGGLCSGRARSKPEAESKQLLPPCLPSASSDGEAKTNTLSLSALRSKSDPPVSPPPGDPVPEPLKLEPTGGKPRRAKAAETTLPDDWQPTDKHYDLGLEKGLTEEQVRSEAELFCAAARAKARRYANWDSAFQTWILNEAKWSAERQKR